MSLLLSPAGDLEKLKYAVLYGADAVYLGGQNFGMRARAGNFSEDDLIKGVDYAHCNGAELYVTLNIAAHNDDVRPMLDFARRLSSIGVDGLIISDPGILMSVREMLPDMFITLSTQANTTNYKSVEFWNKLGVNRVVLARELGYSEIKAICEAKPENMQIEVFVHGAMCISYSGRCLISNYMAGRDSNRGDCAQPCRWEYTIKEKQRSDNFTVEEDGHGSYFFNSKDLCLISRMKMLLDAGVDAFKIEGRMKSNYYVACVTNAYREAIKRCENGCNYEWQDLYNELCKVSHRQYTEAFFEKKADGSSQNYSTSSYKRDYTFVAQVLEDTDINGFTKISQRNKFEAGDKLDVISPGCIGKEFIVKSIYDEERHQRVSAPHAAETLYIEAQGLRLKKDDLIRKQGEN